MKTWSRSLASALAFAAVAQAQPTTPMPRGPSAAQIVSLLNLDAQRAQVVQAILDDARQRMEEVRADVDKQLAAVLSADELAKLRQSMPHPQRRPEAN